MLRELRKAGTSKQVDALAGSAAAHAPIGSAYTIARLLDVLREAGADEQVKALADRAVHVSLESDFHVDTLLGALCDASATDQTAELGARLPDAAMFGEFIALEPNRTRYRFGP